MPPGFNMKDKGLPLWQPRHFFGLKDTYAKACACTTHRAWGYIANELLNEVEIYGRLMNRRKSPDHYVLCRACVSQRENR